jgi:hypothetical protein
MTLSGEVMCWEISGVCTWLRKIKLGRYTKQFENKEIDGKALVLLNDEDNSVVIRIPSVLERRHFTREYEKLFEEQRKTMCQWDETQVIQFLETIEKIEDLQMLKTSHLDGKQLLQLTPQKATDLNLSSLHFKYLHSLQKEKLDTLPFAFDFDGSSDESSDENDEFLEEQKKCSYLKVRQNFGDAKVFSIRIHANDSFEKFSNEVLGMFGLMNTNQTYKFTFFNHCGDQLLITKDEDLSHLIELAKEYLIELIVSQN